MAERTPATKPYKRRMATDEEAQALASGLRLRILRLCLHEPHTNKEIAEVLDRDPGSTLHHIRRLVRTGFLEPQAERRGNRNAREVPYLATGKSWRLSAPGPDRAIVDAFLEEAAEAGIENVEMSRLGIQVSAAEMDEFRSRLYELLEDFERRPYVRDAEPWSIFVALHPDVARRAARPNPRAEATGDVSPWNDDD